MKTIPIGVANSISANFDFDPLDTIQFARQSEFEIIQIYLSGDLLSRPDKLEKIRAQESYFRKVYFHAEGLLNEDFFRSEYQEKLYAFLDTVSNPNYIIHFDETMDIDKLVQTLEKVADSPVIYLENYFSLSGKANAEKNMKKYLALFTLVNMFHAPLRPVFDIPRIFHINLELTPTEGMQWCYQILNFFGNRHVPLLLHLIDTTSPQQLRGNFTALGEGIIPYSSIFQFILKTQPEIEGIILEFEDKLNSLQSREYLLEVLSNDHTK